MLIVLNYKQMLITKKPKRKNDKRNKAHPTFRVIRQSCNAYSLSLKYSSFLKPYALRFIVLTYTHKSILFSKRSDMRQLHYETGASALFRVYGDVASVQLHYLLCERHADAVTLYGVLLQTYLQKVGYTLFVLYN